MEIVNRQHGAFFPQVVMDGKSEPITKILEGTLIGTSAILDQLKLDRRSVGVVNITDVANGWFSDTGTDIKKSGIYVPSLDELGYEAGAYEMKAAIELTCYDNVSTQPLLEARLLNYEDFSVVTGFSASGTLQSQGADEVIRGEAMKITPGQTYMVDYRTENGKTAGVRVASLLIQIVKK